MPWPSDPTLFFIEPDNVDPVVQKKWGGLQPGLIKKAKMRFDNEVQTIRIQLKSSDEKDLIMQKPKSLTIQ